MCCPALCCVATSYIVLGYHDVDGTVSIANDLTKLVSDALPPLCENACGGVQAVERYDTAAG